MLEFTVNAELKLRTLREEDAEELFRLVDANRQHLREWLPWLDANTDVGQTRTFIRSSMDQEARNRLNYSGAYAQANNMWVVCCNCVAPNAYGLSVIMSRTGEPLVVLPTDAEALAVATVDLAATRTWEPWQSRIDRRGYP